MARTAARRRRSEQIGEPFLDPSTLAELHDLARAAGITHTGVAPATVLSRARTELHRRKTAGLADGMQFTYRNPDRSTDPQRAVPGAAAVYVGAMPYPAELPPRPSGPQGRVARYAWADRYDELRRGLWVVADRLRELGWKAVPFADDNSIVDREVAHLAGIGWFGKNANVLIPGAGSWFVLGCVVTTAPLPVAVRVAPDGCGSCHRCIDRCPTGAIVAPGVIDARRCLSWILQKPGVIPVRWRTAIGDRLYGCDDCQEVCPPTRRGAPVASPTIRSSRPSRAWVNVVELLDADDDAAVAAWGQWYLADRDPRWIRRNALVVAGNHAPPAPPQLVASIARYVVDPDPVLRAHAIWAARRLGLDELVPATDGDAEVRAELAEAVSRG